jgi:phospholipid/cholesterol/gamma-HCH transport system substrate-binding protein
MDSKTPNPNTPAPAPVSAAKPIANIEVKAVLLLLLMLTLMCSTVFYVLYARGAFESTQELVLLAEDSEGVVVGMDMTFSGFPIGRVRRVELAENGNVRIIIDVPSKDARWLRTSSVFTMESGLVGNTKIRAYSGVLTDPPLPDNSERNVLRGDTAAEIPKLVALVKDLTQNLVTMTGKESSLNQSLANVQVVTETLKAPGGGMKVLAGDDLKLALLSKQLTTTLDRTNTLLLKFDGIAGKADKQVFGDKGLVSDTQTTVKQVTATLADARASLQKLDAVLLEAQGVASNAKVATADLDTLRAEVESSLRKVDQLVGEINRKWPFARDTQLKLP